MYMSMLKRSNVQSLQMALYRAVVHVEWWERNFENDHVQNAVDVVFDYIIAAVIQKDKKANFVLTR